MTPPHSNAPGNGHLIEAAKRGDKDAFACLFHQHSARIYKFVLRILGNREDAQDIVQEAFLKAYTHLNSFQERARFSTWLTRIALNSALMELRKRRKGRLLPLDGTDGEHAVRRLEVADCHVDIYGACEYAEISAHIAKATCRLKPMWQEILDLQMSFDYSHEELAAMTNISVPAVKSRMLRAKRALRLLLEKQRVLDRGSRRIVSDGLYRYEVTAARVSK